MMNIIYLEESNNDCDDANDMELLNQKLMKSFPAALTPPQLGSLFSVWVQSDMWGRERKVSYQILWLHYLHFTTFHTFDSLLQCNQIQILRRGRRLRARFVFGSMTWEPTFPEASFQWNTNLRRSLRRNTAARIERDPKSLRPKVKSFLHCCGVCGWHEKKWEIQLI